MLFSKFKSIDFRIAFIESVALLHISKLSALTLKYFIKLDTSESKPFFWTCEHLFLMELLFSYNCDRHCTM